MEWEEKTLEMNPGSFEENLEVAVKSNQQLCGQTHALICIALAIKELAEHLEKALQPMIFTKGMNDDGR